MIIFFWKIVLNIKLVYIPSCIRRYFPSQFKNKNSKWCVFLCKEHHIQADIYSKEVHGDLLKTKQKFLNLMNYYKNFINFCFAKIIILKYRGINNISKKYLNKLLKLKPKYLPKELKKNEEISVN